MIKKFEVNNYKCHYGWNEFEFPGLTIVSGTNNSGKSSLLQSVYILTQNNITHLLGTNIIGQLHISDFGQYLPTIFLNDDINIGSFSEILNKQKGNDDVISFAFTFDKEILKSDNLEILTINFTYKNPQLLHNLVYKYVVPEDIPILEQIDVIFKKNDDSIKNMTLKLDEEQNYFYKITGGIEEGHCKITGLTPDSIIYKDIKKDIRNICSREFETFIKYTKLISKDKFKYLRAYRADDYRETDKSGIKGVGISGEYTAEVISSKYDTEVDYIDPDGNPIKFSKLFDEWIKKLLGNQYKVRSIQTDKNKYKIIIKDSNIDLELTLNQVGFGISQLLPILTLILTSKRGDMLLIENPEIHLHPKLQADLADLLIFALENGRRLIVETHSENIINRIRLRIKQNNKLLDKINIYFFEKDDEIVTCNEIVINEQGKINNWPKNFLDQSYTDLLGLIEK